MRRLWWLCATGVQVLLAVLLRRDIWRLGHSAEIDWCVQLNSASYPVWDVLMCTGAAAGELSSVGRQCSA